MIQGGLSSEEARKRFSQLGPNVIQRKRGRGAWRLLWNQFASPLTLLLLLVAVISFGLGFLPSQDPHVLDTVLIILVVLISALLGFVQDYQAERAIESIQALAASRVLVVRDGVEQELPSAELVPGDVVLLSAGEAVPADARVVSTLALSVNEAPLTGESLEVHKQTGNEVFLGTFVMAGEAVVEVVETGLRTRMGAIASKLETIDGTRTPFELELDRMVRQVSRWMLLLALLVFLLAYVRFGAYEAILMAIALAVAAVPEGLPAVVALTLALGAKRMSRRQAVVRRMSATESLGSVNVICTDKTGTLTQNDMRVTWVWTTEEALDWGVESRTESEAILATLEAGLLASGVRMGEENGVPTYLGDSTEIALAKAAHVANIFQDGTERGGVLERELPFTSERKMSSRVYTKEEGQVLYAKGAIEVILPRCTHVLQKGKVVVWTEDERTEALRVLNEAAGRGLRMIACAKRIIDASVDAGHIEEQLVFLGAEGMQDPLHEGVPGAIAEAHEAGIRVIMITGDSPQTALAIAKEAGIPTTGVVLGSELDVMDDAELGEKLEGGMNVFARVSPFHKLRILELLQKEARVVMTGDGVNDALALKRADVGVAMGLRGTDVAKESSDVILTDDNFVSIIAAIREGRTIFDNIQKFVNYLFTSNLAETFSIVVLLFIGTSGTLPLLPIQLLWVNLLTDGLPALALGVDPSRPGVLSRPARPKGAPLLDRSLLWTIGSVGVLKGSVLVGVYVFVERVSGGDVARTALFTGFVLYEFVRIGVIRAQEHLSWHANPWLLLALLGSVGLQLLVLFTPLRSVLQAVPLTGVAWVTLVCGAGVTYGLALGVTKMITRRFPIS